MNTVIKAAALAAGVATGGVIGYLAAESSKKRRVADAERRTTEKRAEEELERQELEAARRHLESLTPEGQRAFIGRLAAKDGIDGIRQAKAAERTERRRRVRIIGGGIGAAVFMVLRFKQFPVTLLETFLCTSAGEAIAEAGEATAALVVQMRAAKGAGLAAANSVEREVAMMAALAEAA